MGSGTRAPAERLPLPWRRLGRRRHVHHRPGTAALSTSGRSAAATPASGRGRGAATCTPASRRVAASTSASRGGRRTRSGTGRGAAAATGGHVTERLKERLRQGRAVIVLANSIS